MDHLTLLLELMNFVLETSVLIYTVKMASLATQLNVFLELMNFPALAPGLGLVSLGLIDPA